MNHILDCVSCCFQPNEDTTDALTISPTIAVSCCIHGDKINQESENIAGKELFFSHTCSEFHECKIAQEELKTKE